MTKVEAEETFRLLIARYGIQWDAHVPAEAHRTLAAVNAHLTEQDRRRIAARLRSNARTHRAAQQGAGGSRQ